MCTLQWLGSDQLFGYQPVIQTDINVSRTYTLLSPDSTTKAHLCFQESSSQVNDKFEKKEKKKQKNQKLLNKIKDMTLTFGLSKHTVRV